MLHRYFIYLALSLTAALSLFSAARSAVAQPELTCTSQSSGDWSRQIRWSCGRVPTSADDVVIATGHVVSLNTSSVISSLTVDGTLVFGNNNTARTMSVSGAVTINADGTLRVGTGGGAGLNATHTLNIAGNFSNNGTFNAGPTFNNRKINTVFNGTAPQTISGNAVANFFSIVINSGATVIVPNTNIPNVAAAGFVTNNGVLQQTRAVNNANVPFLTLGTDRYRGVDVDTSGSGANLGDVAVTIVGNSGPTCTTSGGSSPAYAYRCFAITPTNPGSARITLWATTGEQNSIATPDLIGYRFAAGSWQALTNNSSGTASNNYIFAAGDTPGFSSFLLGDVNSAPTAVTLQQLGVAQSVSWAWGVVVMALLLLSGIAWQKRRQHR